ncbi:MAG TPA: AsmA family protein [Burkholderiales bacterium]|nr:AsmA family protein [Burkholderiales bacterium]
MNKPLKYVLLGLGGLVVLVIAGVVIVAATFDPNRYKGDIERIAKEKTGRTLKLAGDLELAFYPAIGAKVAGVTLSERASDQEFLSLESAHVSVKLIPLLRGEMIVDTVRVAGLKAQVVKGKDGRFNFDDLLAAEDAKKPAAKPQPQPEAQGEAVKFDIAGVKVERSAIAYRDLAAGTEIALSDVKLSTGRIAEKAAGKLEFAAHAKGKNPELDAKVQLDTDYRVDLAAKSYALAKLALDLKGLYAKESIEAKVRAPQLDITANSAKGQAVTAEFKLKGAERSIDAALKLSGVEGSAKALVIPQFAADLSMTSPDLPMKTIKLPVTGSLRADLEKQTANADLAIKLDDSTIQAKLGLAKFSPPAYQFDVNVDRLNVDKYLPQEPAKPAPPAAKPAPPAAKPAPAPQKADTPIDLSFLKELNASGKLQFGALQVRGLKLANVQAQVRAANGRMDIAPHSASLYEGTLNGALSAQADNRITLKESLTNVSVGPLLRDVAQQDRLEGRGNIALDVTASGKSVDAMKKALNGAAKLHLRDGAVKGINLAEVMRKAKSALGAESAQAADKNEKTDFSELSASFTIKNGVAHNEDLDIKAPLLRVTGKGDIDIGNSRLDYVTKAAVVGSAKGQGGAERSDLAGLTVPVRLVGSFDDLKYQVDYRGAAAELAKSKAGDKIKERLGDNREKLEEKLGGKLRGLLGR